ncbi:MULTISPECIES: SseB family protein [unclassified Streptomyces]|uniref:SseB family protein n=1 Tax=unclassified Streptomyces TaxID=2593676 RepID=UPI001837889D
MGFDEEWGRLRAAVDGGGLPPTLDPVTQAREAARERLAGFRSRTVLVPLDVRGGLWTAELGGLYWICVFSDEEALARFAEARNESGREWTYRRVAGARLLDELLPGLDFRCGVAWNAAGPDGTVFPPIRGIVPNAAAIDGETAA